MSEKVSYLRDWGVIRKIPERRVYKSLNVEFMNHLENF